EIQTLVNRISGILELTNVPTVVHDTNAPASRYGSFSPGSNTLNLTNATFNIVHERGGLINQLATIVHELTHAWQYQQISMYEQARINGSDLENAFGENLYIIEATALSTIALGNSQNVHDYAYRWHELHAFWTDQEFQRLLLPNNRPDFIDYSLHPNSNDLRGGHHVFSPIRSRVGRSPGGVRRLPRPDNGEHADMPGSRISGPLDFDDSSSDGDKSQSSNSFHAIANINWAPIAHSQENAETSENLIHFSEESPTFEIEIWNPEQE
ncbi:MAG: hypothetical protein AAGA30_20680, partial [Planctomycetota bacterium]